MKTVAQVKLAQSASKAILNVCSSSAGVGK